LTNTGYKINNTDVHILTNIIHISSHC